MKNYTVEITELLQKQFEITAASQEEAIKIVKEAYNKEEIVLTEKEYVDTKIDVIEEKQPSKVDILRYQYPIGCRIQCLCMEDPYHPIPAGTKGTVDHVDDAGTIHMCWDNGSSLGLIPGEDLFKKIEEPKQEKAKNNSKER